MDKSESSPEREPPFFGSTFLTAAFFPGSAFFFGSLRFLFPLFFGAGTTVKRKNAIRT